MHFPAVSREGRVCPGEEGGGGGGGCGGESRSRPRRKRSMEAGDGRGQLTADALNLTDGEG